MSTSCYFLWTDLVSGSSGISLYFSFFFFFFFLTSGTKSKVNHSYQFWGSITFLGSLLFY